MLLEADVARNITARRRARRRLSRHRHRVTRACHRWRERHRRCLFRWSRIRCRRQPRVRSPPNHPGKLPAQFAGRRVERIHHYWFHGLLLIIMRRSRRTVFYAACCGEGMTMTLGKVTRLGHRFPLCYDCSCLLVCIDKSPGFRWVYLPGW